MQILKRIKQILILAISASVLMLICTLLFTESGIRFMYPFAVRKNAESFVTSSNSYVVYYGARESVVDADIILIGMDDRVAQSYDIAGHFLRFIKQYNNISVVLLDADKLAITNINRLLDEEDSTKYVQRITNIRQNIGMSLDFADFASELYYINQTVTPNRKFKAVSYADTQNKGYSLSERISRASIAAINEGRSMIAFVKPDELDVVASDLRDHLTGKNVSCFRIEYSNCQTEDETITTINLPSISSKTKTFFVSSANQNDFLDYAENVLNFFGNETENIRDNITGNMTDWYFIVSNGTPATYYHSDVTNTASETDETNQ